MKISRQKLLTLGDVLSHIESIFQSPIPGRFYYAAAKNRALAEEERRLYMESYPDPPEWTAVETRRLAIIDEIGEKAHPGFSSLGPDAKNAIIRSDGPATMSPELHEELVRRIDELLAENKDAVAARDETGKARAAFLAEEDDFPIKTVKVDDVPPVSSGNGLAIFTALDPMIAED